MSGCLIVYFNKAARRKKGYFRDDDGTIIPDEIIDFQDGYYIRFKKGWKLIAHNDYFEIQYPSVALVFAEGRVQNVVVNYSRK